MMSPGYGLPDDLDEFWAHVVAEAKSAPLDYRRSRVDALGEGWVPYGHRLETIAFRGMRGEPRHGWIAVPEGARAERSFLWIPPYGRESKLPEAYGTRPGFVSMSLNLLGEGPFHQERYSPSRGYFAQGAGSPDTWIFRTMVQDAMIALRVLEAQIEVDEDRIGVMGMSQGGGLSIWLGATWARIRAVVADMPFLSGAAETLGRSAYRYPLKELADFAARQTLGEQMVNHTLSYFDTAHLATRCEVPTLVSFGEKDPACRPESVRQTYDALPGVEARGEKRLVAYPGGHDWDPEMIPTNQHWLEQHLGPRR